MIHYFPRLQRQGTGYYGACLGHPHAPDTEHKSQDLQVCPTLTPTVCLLKYSRDSCNKDVGLCINCSFRITNEIAKKYFEASLLQNQEIRSPHKHGVSVIGCRCHQDFFISLWHVFHHALLFCIASGSCLLSFLVFPCTGDNQIHVVKAA